MTCTFPSPKHPSIFAKLVPVARTTRKFIVTGKCITNSPLQRSRQSMRHCRKAWNAGKAGNNMRHGPRNGSLSLHGKCFLNCGHCQRTKCLRSGLTACPLPKPMQRKPSTPNAMNTKHTPGPWIAKEQYRDSVTNDVSHFVMWQDRSKPGVMLRRLDDKKGAFSAADAKLIATAPDLLNALRIMVDATSVETIDPLVMFVSIEKARAPIAKDTT